MASNVVRKVLADVLNDDTWNIETERAVLMKKSASYIINKAGGEGCNRFDKFAKDIYKVFEEILSKLSMQDTKSFEKKFGATFKLLD